MSATGHPKIISAHAEYRHGNYMFARTQSRSQRELAWERRATRLISWSEMLYAALGIAAAMLIGLGAIY